MIGRHDSASENRRIIFRLRKPRQAFRVASRRDAIAGAINALRRIGAIVGGRSAQEILHELKYLRFRMGLPPAALSWHLEIGMAEPYV